MYRSYLFLTVLLALLLMVSGASYARANDNAASITNLKSAITGETTAGAKYAAYAQKAREEGYARIALLFEAASKAENIHAGNHRAALQELGVKMDEVKPKFEVKSTRENLLDAIKGETYEITTMYPEFIKTANSEGTDIALITFNYAYKTEKKHKALYEKALAALDAKSMETLSTKYMVCMTCGNTYDGEAPARCGISMTPRERFITFQ